MAREINTKTKNNSVSSTKLELLMTVINRSKAEYYTDLIQSFDVNMQTVMYSEGTANQEILSSLGITSSNKALIMSVINKKNSKKALLTLEEKFKTIKNGSGIAFTIPMSSIIGVSIFSFLSNNRTYMSNKEKEKNNGIK